MARIHNQVPLKVRSLASPGSAQFTLPEVEFPSAEPLGRHRGATATKRQGIHYTPPDLARFLATQAIAAVSGCDTLRVLDPSCGDGALLAAIAEAAPERPLFLCGMDQDAAAIEAAHQRLAKFNGGKIEVELHKANFLQDVIRARESNMLELEPGSIGFNESFDVVIANPPYVRTQVLGASMARQLAEQFGLSGRIDLYQAFVVAMTDVLKSHGTMALLCSNRFMTTRAGRDLRKFLATRLQISHVFDLGDTKLFSAAVLPAVVIAKKQPQVDQSFAITSIYESRELEVPAIAVESIFERLTGGNSESVTIDGRVFAVRSSNIVPVHWDQPWVAVSEAENELQHRIASTALMRFRDIGKIRVGIKTTCDDVFIRPDWSDLPKNSIPENELLLPLLTHQIASRWRAVDAEMSVLYPYDLTNERRIPVDLALYPRAERYLELNRQRLESRTYVTEGGRNWWEIWVPQRPSVWRHRKIVFPDISDKPKFWMDVSGAVVNGDCYWMSVPDNDPDDVSLLMLAVANSKLGSEFYDQTCGNRLYAGRRRYITQYVSEFPIPNPTSPESQKIIHIVEALLQSKDPDRNLELESEIDNLVWRAFGIEERSR